MTGISAAAQARDLAQGQDVAEIGGQFTLSRACHRYLAGAAAIELPAAHPEAVTQLSQAAGLYDAGPEPGEDHSEQCKNLARIDLATAFLAAGELDAAVEATGQILILPPGRRVCYLPARLARLRGELAAARYRRTPQARELDELIEGFCAETITTRLRQAASSY
ncbi:MAG TPA: hypothetical protein VFQ44_21600 [Streptosporangiaceae bacterium]|nr:hypothetical protein [Streptosporangiaceae bacterium]